MESGKLNFDVSGSALAYTTSNSLEEFLANDNEHREQYSVRLREARLGGDDQLFFNSYPDTLYLLMLVTVEDPDTLAVLPVVARIVDAAPRLGLRIVRDDADLGLLNALVDDTDLLEDLEEMDLPQIFFFDEEWQLQDQWGPRPQAAEQRLEEWLERHPEYDTLADDDDAYVALVEELNSEMRLWYNSGLSQECVREIRAVLAGLQSDAETEDVNE